MVDKCSVYVVYDAIFDKNCIVHLYTGLGHANHVACVCVCIHVCTSHDIILTQPTHISPIWVSAYTIIIVHYYFDNLCKYCVYIICMCLCSRTPLIRTQIKVRCPHFN